MELTGSEILLRSLEAEGTDTIFGYPGGSIMPVYDALYDHTRDGRLRHVLVRHEQGAIHAAQGYARESGKVGVVIVTSGPGATNTITGITDAMSDSTPVIVISGQVVSSALGTDAFQEADIIGMTSPITKWNFQIRRPEDVAPAVAKAFYIASSGRPGPVVLDFTKDAQTGLAEYNFEKCTWLRSYIPVPTPDSDAIEKAAELINGAKKPFVLFGQGIILSHAEKELREFIEKADIPAAATMLGLSALPSDHRLFKGMTGMHGTLAANKMTSTCDVLVAVGMRFDDRVTGDTSTYARQAKIIHIDIDPAEIGKIIRPEVGIAGDAKEVLGMLLDKISPAKHGEWIRSTDECESVEKEVVAAPEVSPSEGHIRMGEVVEAISSESKGKAVVVTDVGQNQLIGARYSRFVETRSFLTSGGLGTMGFGLPAAIGAKIAEPGRQVCLLVGDGGIQMTIEELGTIMQEGTGVKIVILNNNWLGNVRMWQQLFFRGRYSETRMLNPDYGKIAEGYGISYRMVEDRRELPEAVREMLSDDRPYILDVHVEESTLVMPMIPGGKSITSVMIRENEWYKLD